MTYLFVHSKPLHCDSLTAHEAEGENSAFFFKRGVRGDELPAVGAESRRRLRELDAPALRHPPGRSALET